MPKKSTKSSARKTKTYNSGWLKTVCKIENAEGLHTRPAAAFVKLAQQFGAQIRVRRGNFSADGKSILGILSLGLKKGSPVTIQTKGDQAKEALKALGRLVQRGFYEE